MPLKRIMRQIISQVRLGKYKTYITLVLTKKQILVEWISLLS